MRILKLVIWDLDETLLLGILEEGQEQINPVASQLLRQLDERGVLQAVATQNSPNIIPLTLKKFDWSDLFVQVEADFGPKAKKVRHILEVLEIDILDTVFVDEEPFERDAMAIQLPGITAWSLKDLTAYLSGATAPMTDEARRRLRMYREQQTRNQAEESASDYINFLHSCNIQITIRPYLPEDKLRAEELLTRTHRMNLGVLSIEEAISRLNRPDEHHVIVAEMKDVYGDRGRCGLIHLTPDCNNGAFIESLAISCRTRARGLSLAMLAGMLGHPHNNFHTFRCQYIFNGANRPLRMLLMAIGFKPQPRTNELTLSANQLAQIELLDWVNISYHPVLEKVR